MILYVFYMILITLSISSIGTAHAGQLLAIIGPTGCGKTSLLNVLGKQWEEVVDVILLSLYVWCYG